MASKPSVFFHRVQSLLKYALLGASLTLFILLGHGEADLKPLLASLPLLNAGVSSVSAQSPIDAPQLIEKGRQSYEKGEFSDAVTFWQQAARLFAIQEDRLDRAQVLSFISLAYQQLGQWGKAEEAIRDSLNLLRTEENSPILAQALTNKGHLQLALGKAEDALKTWQQATDIYAYLKDETGATGSLVNQSLAMQESGLYRRACQTLLPALKLENSVCDLSSETEQPVSKRKQLGSLKSAITKQPDSLIRGVGLRSLGDVLRVIGKLEESQEVLQQSLEIAKRLNSTPDISATNLSLGNTERAFYNRNKDLFDRSNLINDRDNAKTNGKQALEEYQQVNYSYFSKKLSIKAKLNQLSLLIDLNNWLITNNQEKSAERLQQDIKYLTDSFSSLQSDIANLPLNHTTVYERINFARSLSSNYFKDKFILTAIQQNKEALKQAQDLKDERSESYAIGTLGYLYEQQNNFSEAQKLTQQALSIAQSVYALDIAYQWQWQLGRIYKKRHDNQKAITAYDAAIKSLDLVRRDLLTINPDVQFSFRDNVKPVYVEYLELLLQAGASSDELNKAIQVTEALNIAEIENFLQCAQINLVSLDKTDSPPSAIIYPILFKDRIEVIVKLFHPKNLAGNLNRYTTFISKEEFEKTLYTLQGRLSDKQIDVKQFILPPAQQLYEWLIRRAASDLPESGTLVFVLDSSLQGIPFAVLHDGKSYLVEKHSIAVSLGSQLPNPKQLQPGQWNVLLAGVSEKAESFPPELPALPNVKDELLNIKSIVPSQELLNQQFTSEAIRNQINATSFPVIHLATHGQFSSDPKETLIYSWYIPIEVREIDRLLRSRGQTSRNPIELLVLSACETAKADKQAALGIAGVALKADARSTVASLWKVSDGSTAFFMTQFYQELNTKGVIKAEALQKVQKTFLNSSDFQHPYYWAAFILAGNWL